MVDHPARILIVDDERRNRELLEVMLAPDGFLLQSAASGEEALAMVAAHAPDLILLDVMMPGMDGYEVTARLKAQASTKHIPIIMITALNDRDARLRGLTAGVEEFLTKPADRAELTVRVRNLLRLKAYADHFEQYSQVLEGEVGLGASRLVESERLSESALRYERDRAQRYLHTAAVILLALDPQGRITLVNPFACSALGWTSDELLGRDWIQTCVPARIRGDLREKFQNLLSGDLSVIESPVLTSSGEERVIEWHNTVQRDGTGQVIGTFSSGTDITARNGAVEAQKMDALAQLASGIARDFKHRLTVILGYSRLLAEDETIDRRHAKDFVEIIGAAQRAAGLTKQLLAFSRQQLLKTAPVDVNRLITEMDVMLARLIGEHIEITLALDQNLPFALADRDQLEQVVMNLVVNATDAMAGGGRVTIETSGVQLDNSSLRDEAVMPGHYVMLAVSDTGSGMTKETERRLFEPFFTTKEAGKGTGLGLSTTYGIVKQSNGYIGVDSEPGHGSTLKVYLPVASDAVPLKDSKSGAAPVERGSETVLLVEDEDGLRSAGDWRDLKQRPLRDI